MEGYNNMIEPVGPWILLLALFLFSLITLAYGLYCTVLILFKCYPAKGVVLFWLALTASFVVSQMSNSLSGVAFFAIASPIVALVLWFYGRGVNRTYKPGADE